MTWVVGVTLIPCVLWWLCRLRLLGNFDCHFIVLEYINITRACVGGVRMCVYIYYSTVIQVHVSSGSGENSGGLLLCCATVYQLGYTATQ